MRQKCENGGLGEGGKIKTTEKERREGMSVTGSSEY